MNLLGLLAIVVALAAQAGSKTPSAPGLSRIGAACRGLRTPPPRTPALRFLPPPGLLRAPLRHQRRLLRLRLGLPCAAGVRGHRPGLVPSPPLRGPGRRVRH